MSECVGLHSTCHAASLRRLCIRAHGFSNSLKRVEAEPLLSLWVGRSRKVGPRQGLKLDSGVTLPRLGVPCPLVSFPLEGPGPAPSPPSARFAARLRRTTTRFPRMALVFPASLTSAITTQRRRGKDGDPATSTGRSASAPRQALLLMLIAGRKVVKIGSTESPL